MRKYHAAYTLDVPGSDLDDLKVETSELSQRPLIDESSAGSGVSKGGWVYFDVGGQIIWDQSAVCSGSKSCL